VIQHFKGLADNGAVNESIGDSAAMKVWREHILAAFRENSFRTTCISQSTTDLDPSVSRSHHSLSLEEISEFASTLAGASESSPLARVSTCSRWAARSSRFSRRGSPEAISLKCEAELAIDLRLQYAAVIPGYHLNKRLWNTVHMDGTVPDDEIIEMVSHSYEQVVAGLPKSVRLNLVASD